MIVRTVVSTCGGMLLAMGVWAMESSPSVGIVANSPLWDPPFDAVHIDPMNLNDTEEDGSREHPYNSLDDFQWQANRVYAIRRGTTLETPQSITIGVENVILCSYGESDYRPVIFCTGKPTSGGNGVHAVQFRDVSTALIRDVEVLAPNATSCVRFWGCSEGKKAIINGKLSGAEWGIRGMYSTGLKVLNTEIFHIGDDGIFMQGSKDIEIANCWVHHVNKHWLPPSTPESLASGDGIQLDECDRWYVHHNVIDRSDTGNKFCFISNNPDQSQGIFEFNVTYGPLGDGGASIYFHNGTGLVVRYNKLLGPAPSPLYTHADNILFYGNVVTQMKGPLFASRSAAIYNNTFYDVGQIATGGDLTVTNNIVHLTNPQNPAFGKIDNLTASHNLFANSPSNSAGITRNPDFVDPENGDFHLGPRSPALNRGKEMGMTHDIDGVPVPQGSAPEIGAYESMQPIATIEAPPP